MLVVIPDIVREEVERAVIGVRLLVEAVPDIVLGDEVACSRVERTGEERGEEEVKEGARAEATDEKVVKDELDGYVDEVPDGGRLGTDETWTESVEEDLESSGGQGSGPALHRVLVFTYAKKVFPRTLLRHRSSKLVGKSVSIPSSPRCL